MVSGALVGGQATRFIQLQDLAKRGLIISFSRRATQVIQSTVISTASCIAYHVMTLSLVRFPRDSMVGREFRA